jgi:hypothetical protein
MCDHHPDFVHMGCQHNTPALLANLPFAGDQVSQSICSDFICYRLNDLTDRLANFRFVSGWTRDFN